MGDKKVPAVPNDPAIEFVELPAALTKRVYEIGSSEAPTKFVRFGLWDNAFCTAQHNTDILTEGAADRPGYGVDSDMKDEVPNTIKSGELERDNLAGGDSRRFYVRVIDPTASNQKFVDVRWQTFNPDGSALDFAATRTLTLLRVEGSDPPVFVSRGLILSPFENDRPKGLHSGLPSKHSDPIVRSRSTLRSHNEPDYRIRQGAIGGFVEIEYIAPSRRSKTERATIFNPDKVRNLTLEVFLLTRPSPDGDTNPSPTVVRIDAASPFWSENLANILLIYAQFGIQVKSTVALPGSITNNVFGRPFSAQLLHKPGVDVDKIAVADMRLIGRGLPQGQAGTIRIIVANRISIKQHGEDLDKLRGVAFTRSIVQRLEATECENLIFIGAKHMNPHTIAHEVGHILMDKPSSRTNPDAHYMRAVDPASLQQHLMRASGGPGALEPHLGNRRLYPTGDGDGYNYLNILENNATYLRS